MRIICLLLVCSILPISVFAQSEIYINLDNWIEKKQKLPFKIKKIEDNRSEPELIGTIKTAKNKGRTVRFEGPSERIFENFISKNFRHGSAMNIRMEIEQFKIQEVKIRKKEVSAFFFKCTFYDNDNTGSGILYTYKSRNIITKKKGLQSAMERYVGRAFTAAIENFNQSYKKHPEWKGKRDDISAPIIKINKTIIYNQFQVGDTIAADGIHQLNADNFSGIVGDEEKDDAYSFMFLTYHLKAVDNKTSIDIDIRPKVYFLRSQSWAKKEATTNWLSHEQLLFDLASYHGILFKKELIEKSFSAGYYKTEVNNIYHTISKNYFDEMDQLQADTQFGSNQAKEAEWREKIIKYLGK